MSPGDGYEVKPEHSHRPLVVMLVLTQLSVGAFCTATILRLFFPSDLLRELTPFHSLVALLLGFLALGASTMHLGRPLEAWRSFVGLKTSWLSREIIVFGLFAMLTLIYAGSFWLPALSRFVLTSATRMANSNQWTGTQRCRSSRCASKPSSTNTATMR
jgi:formate dehydrogenase iron-sulfur subunit